ncbi:MAG: SAF domain-containing protein [Brachybacterium sp.]|nr:SAF domain-containing protein [Brachybacterium sp.]
MSVPASSTLRLRRPRWKDPRLIIGIVLVVLSVLAGSLLVHRLAQTTPVLVAREDVVVGDTLDPSAFTVVEMRLGEHTEAYATGAEDIPGGAVATRTLGAGEILPRSVIGQSEDVSLRPVVIPVDVAVAESVRPGGGVELWHTPTGREDADPVAQQLVGDGIVRRVDSGSTLAMRSVNVEVLVRTEDLPAVLEALGRGDRVDVIGVPGAQGIDP